MTEKNPAEKKPYHHGNLPRALIDAVLELTAEKGVTGLTMREVSRRADVSHNAPYSHFADMQALLVAVAQEGIWMIRDMLTDAAAGEYEQPLEKLVTFCIRYVRFAVEHREHYRIMFGPHIANPMEHQGLAESSLEVFALVTDAIRQCQDEDLLSSEEPEIIAGLAWSTVHGIANLVAEKRLPIEDLDQVDEMVRLAMRNLYYGLAGENRLEELD